MVEPTNTAQGTDDQDHFEADYLIETPLAPERVAEIMAGEQSCGSFTRVAGETDALRARARAEVIGVETIGVAQTPALPNAWLTRREATGPWPSACPPSWR